MDRERRRIQEYYGLTGKMFHSRDPSEPALVLANLSQHATHSRPTHPGDHDE